CFFFQAEDGIRDGHVTGVQTCALPIWLQDRCILSHRAGGRGEGGGSGELLLRGTTRSLTMSGEGPGADPSFTRPAMSRELLELRSEERRVGKECRSRWAAERLKEKKMR